MQKMKTNKSVLTLTILFGILLRWIIATFPYSGESTPPMFGDFEAQRHWMEVTNKLPVKQWYINSSANHLLYWGLDYPPLTAYHMLLCGQIADTVDRKFIDFEKSRGFESYGLKLFMRLTVLIGDCLIYIPAVILFAMTENNLISGLSSRLDKGLKSGRLITSVSIFLLYPGLILIDHGHFQYNSISLGLMLAAFVAIKQKHKGIGTFLFCLALNYKQMELYHAIPLFLYLFGNAIGSRFKTACYELFFLSFVVICTFVMIWLPFYDTGFVTIQSVVERVFPVGRGLFEDKVSNFWCSLSIMIKFKSLFDASLLFKLSSLLTLLMATPSSIHLFTNPTMSNLSLSLFNVSLTFFLFSFQVHEKSILLCAIPACILFLDFPVECYWFLHLSVISMFPLFVKDDIAYAVFPLLLMFYCLFVHIMQAVDFSYIQVPAIFYPLTQAVDKYVRIRLLSKFFVYTSIFISLSLCIGMLSIAPPKRYPDLFSVCINLYCSLHFLYFLGLFNAYQIFGSKCIFTSDEKTPKKKAS